MDDAKGISMDNVVSLKKYRFVKNANKILKDLEDLLAIASNTEKLLTKHEKYDIVSKWMLDCKEYQRAFKEHILKQKKILKRIEQEREE